jgi:hypothetical protein
MTERLSRCLQLRRYYLEERRSLLEKRISGEPITLTDHIMATSGELCHKCGMVHRLPDRRTDHD